MTRVLFVAPTYMGLYKNILDEMQSQGLEVVFIEDKELKYNYRYRYKHTIKEKIRNIIFFFLDRIKNNKRKLWEDNLRDINNLYFDTLFVINGFSYHKCLLKKLRRYNKSIKTRLYLWDNLYAYDFSYVIRDFDKCYTLDYIDSVKSQKLAFLPSFWVDNDKEDNESLSYDVFMIGTNHDDRFFIVTEIIKQLKKSGNTYLIKLIDKKLPEDEIITHDFLPTREYTSLMKKSRCILDTERPSQSGPTVRLIWALALGKKIISTNSYMREMPFYNPSQILIIERKKPMVNVDFVNDKTPLPNSDYINELRIDRWLNTVLK